MIRRYVCGEISSGAVSCYRVSAQHFFRLASYLRLPRLLQWFTGNIGFHHVHHVDSRIPNYRLEECHYADAGFQLASTLTLRTALLALRYALWDSDLDGLVPFRLAADS